MPLPDPDIVLREASDFILNSPLGRRAQLYNKTVGLSILWRDLLAQIHRLVASCHMPEFTDHGLPHLCSLVDRVSEWTCAPKQSVSDRLVYRMTPVDAATLLTAILVHDIGMLSQSPRDLPDGHPMASTQGAMNVATWVRKSHVSRIRRLVQRLLGHQPHIESWQRPILDSDLMQDAYVVAESHSIWPWEAEFEQLPFRLQGLAAILSVVDILDEDSNRCDTPALLFHRYGTQENRAHWIRHTLTADRVYVKSGRLEVKLLRLPNTDLGFEPIFQAIRNQYRLVRLYNKYLRNIEAGLLDLNFDSIRGCPMSEVDDLAEWETMQGFETQELLVHNLLKTFFPEALLDERRLDEDVHMLLTREGLESIELDSFYAIRGLTEIRSPIEEEISCAIRIKNK